MPPPAVAAHIPMADARPYGHMESFYSEPPMTHADVYPRRDVAYEARETVDTLTGMGARPTPAVEEQVERAGQAGTVETLPPVVEDEITSAV